MSLTLIMTHAWQHIRVFASFTFVYILLKKLNSLFICL